MHAHAPTWLLAQPSDPTTAPAGRPQADLTAITHARNQLEAQTAKRTTRSGWEYTLADARNLKAPSVEELPELAGATGTGPLPFS